MMKPTLAQCPACQHMLSSQARACPQCGHTEPRKLSIGWLLVIIIAIGFGIAAQISLNGERARKQERDTQNQIEDIRAGRYREPTNVRIVP